jgi:hypothetical protein
MHYMVELAIEREAEILDAALECPDIFELPPIPWATSKGRLHPNTRKFSARGTSRRHSTAKAATSTGYIN